MPKNKQTNTNKFYLNEILGWRDLLQKGLETAGTHTLERGMARYAYRWDVSKEKNPRQFSKLSRM